MAVAAESLVTDNVHSVTQRDRNDEHFCKIKSISILRLRLSGIRQNLNQRTGRFKPKPWNGANTNEK